MEDLDVIVEDGKLVIVNNTKEIIKVKWVEIEYLITFNPEELGGKQTRRKITEKVNIGKEVMPGKRTEIQVAFDKGVEGVKVVYNKRGIDLVFEKELA